VQQPLIESPAALLPLARGHVRPPFCSIPSAEPTSTYTPLDAPRLSLKRVNSAGFLTPQLRTGAQLRLSCLQSVTTNLARHQIRT
jgi:hypothetical protein